MTDSDDLAEQQLFAEFQESAKKAQQLPVNSAAHGAALLNAARITAVPPSPLRTSITLGGSRPAGMNGKATKGTGKLKRPSFLRDDLAKQPKPSLARRGDPFELLSSPENAPAKPHARVTEKPPKRKKEKRLLVHGASQESEALPPHPALQEPGVPVDEAPPPSSPPPAKDKRHREEAPETPPRTSGRLAGETVSLSDKDFSKVPEQRPRSRKRKSAERQTEPPRSSKSPRTGGADVIEAHTAEGGPGSTHRNQRAKPTHPQVVVPQKTRAKAGMQNKSSIHGTEQAPVHVENDDTHADQSSNGHERESCSEAVTQEQHEPEDEPPQSAQKPPEEEPELQMPQKPKRRKVRQLKPSKVTNGLDVPSDKEDHITEHSGSSRRVEHDPKPAEVEAGQPRRRKESRSKASYTLGSRDAESHQKQEIEPRELEPKRKRGRLPKASKSFDEKNVTPHQEDGAVEPSGHIKQTPTTMTRKKKKKKKEEEETTTVPAIRSKSARVKSTSSRPQQSNSGARETRNVGDGLDKMLEMDENDNEGNLDEVAADAVGSSEEEEEEDHYDDAQVSDIDKVFRFLDSGERDGDCHTGEAISIEKACETALEVFVDPDTTLDEVRITTRNLQMLLAKYGSDSEEAQQRKALKTDAYAYLFRHVIVHLEALRDWLRDTCSDVESSLDAMCIISPFISSIVSLKDRIADWKVKISSRYKGDRLIKDVDINLIVPLRKVEETYRNTLRALKDSTRQKRVHDEALQKAREREEAEQKKREFEEIKKKKQVFWIDLHVHRLQVEQNPYKRQALAMKQEYFDEQMARWAGDELERREERDANGVQFQRVDVFKKRVVPPAHPSAFIEDKEWTDEEMSVLIEGLTQFSGSYVFHKIFKEHCRHGRPLQRFGVPEITAKAAEIRSLLLAKYQEQDWKDIPQWIRKIPVLP